jgi:CBS domain-containing protein
MDTMTSHINPEQTSLERVRVADAMTTGVITCSPETSLRDVARKMAVHRVHAIFVFDYGLEADENGELWGIVSDLDLVAATCGDLDSITARESAVTPLVTIRSDDRLGHAAQRMAETGVSHLAVLDAVSTRPVGVLSTLDIVELVAGFTESL